MNSKIREKIEELEKLKKDRQKLISHHNSISREYYFDSKEIGTALKGPSAELKYKEREGQKFTANLQDKGEIDDKDKVFRSNNTSNINNTDKYNRTVTLYKKETIISKIIKQRIKNEPKMKKKVNKPSIREGRRFVSDYNQHFSSYDTDYSSLGLVRERKEFIREYEKNTEKKINKTNIGKLKKNVSDRISKQVKKINDRMHSRSKNYIELTTHSADTPNNTRSFSRYNNHFSYKDIKSNPNCMNTDKLRTLDKKNKILLVDKKIEEHESKIKKLKKIKEKLQKL